MEIVRDKCLSLSAMQHRKLCNTHNSLGMVQLDTSCKATLCKQAKLRDDELVELPEIS